MTTNELLTTMTFKEVSEIKKRFKRQIRNVLV